MASVLPTFFQYTVDLRLCEFRFVCQQCGAFETIPFESEAGDKILVELLEFYEAGGTLFKIEHDGQHMQVIPVPFSVVVEATLGMEIW